MEALPDDDDDDGDDELDLNLNLAHEDAEGGNQLKVDSQDPPDAEEAKGSALHRGLRKAYTATWLAFLKLKVSSPFAPPPFPRGPALGGGGEARAGRRSSVPYTVGPGWAVQLTKDIYKDVLARLDGEVMPQLTNPKLLIDFLSVRGCRDFWLLPAGTAPINAATWVWLPSPPSASLLAASPPFALSPSAAWQDSFTLGGAAAVLSLNSLFTLIYHHNLCGGRAKPPLLFPLALR